MMGEQHYSTPLFKSVEVAPKDDSLSQTPNYAHNLFDEGPDASGGVPSLNA